MFCYNHYTNLTGVKMKVIQPKLKKCVKTSEFHYGRMYRCVKTLKGHEQYLGKIFVRIYSNEGIKVGLLENLFTTWFSDCHTFEAVNYTFSELEKGEEVILIQE
jgi:hypothetical protein